MQLAPSDEQVALVESFAALLTKASSFEKVREAEPGGFDPELWAALGDVGAVPMAVAEDRGGWGASLVDLALVAEQVGATTASAPVIETQVAARLLARCDGPVAGDLLDRVLAGEVLVTFAPRPAARGRSELVPAGAVCDGVLVLDGDALSYVAVTDDIRRPVANLASAPLADIELGAASTDVLAQGPAAVDLYEAALDDWLTLTAAALVGMAEVALRQACEYATERHAFGSAIGSFQAISHPLADDATGIDGARLIARKAAWASDTGRSDYRELAAMAFAFACEVAEWTTYDAVHVLGGYGFMLEYDVQLLYRRARGWPRVWGDASTANRRVGAVRYGGR